MNCCFCPLFCKLVIQCEDNNVYFLTFQGYFLLFESMLDSVLYARDLYLADTGSGRSHFVLAIQFKVARRIVNQNLCAESCQNMLRIIFLFKLLGV